MTENTNIYRKQIVSVHIDDFRCEINIRYNKNNEKISFYTQHIPELERLNTKCSNYLGCVMNEYILQHVFNNVVVMPRNNPGYDFICGKGYKVDAKAARIQKHNQFVFNIRYNTIPDYFLCIGYVGNRPIDGWLIPQKTIKHLKTVAIYPTTRVYDKYNINICKIFECYKTIYNGDNNGKI